MGSSLETSDLIQTKAQPKSEDFKEKLLPGVLGYLNQPTVYENKTIMEATMNLSETCRIGKSVYWATINGMVLAVKKTKEDVCGEELKILQIVNHANLVRLVGISSDTAGNRFLVYEYAENGSLDSSLAFLTWNQRLNIALDVAKAAFGEESHGIGMLWKEIRCIFEVEEERREERLRKWIDPNLKGFCPIDGAISLAALGRACTLDKSMARPSMGEIVYSLSVLTQSSPETNSERSWTVGVERDEATHIVSPVKAR
ncbi:hypothetical protein FH972_005535 [Carpinus fangiana]|uniref:Protein kinase domain-containing protein n=1 Tax=Carpinus fangiana TaxID=176857 RepID=A0A5N6QPL0_9ROSI|nr:hypothetical protein FH972_005535 [Carpinus fangiana]